MLVYSSQLCSRLKYVLEFVSNELFDEQAQLTDDQQEFVDYDGAKINYSQSRITKNEFWIRNVELLYQTGIRQQPMVLFEDIGYKAFFQSHSDDFSFDLFAATFYLLSRYEEYLPHTKDKYGRYAHTNSVAYRESFLQLPLINIWLYDLKKKLLQKYPDLKFRNKAFTFTPTYDIDIAWSYRNKGWWRNTGGVLRSILKQDWISFKERIDVLSGKRQDPFDTYGWLNALHKQSGLKAIYFFLLASKQQGFDKNISPLKTDLQRLIQQHDTLYTTGIHPSWQSGDNDELLKKEIKLLERLSDHDITYSRQHYLRFTVPVTFRKLIQYGIKNEYSMGYGTVNGFRASVASSFYWYDLENEQTTDLLIHPFCFMDANAFYELKLSPQQALEELMSFYKIIKKVDGLMITLWHNNFLGSDRSFAGWRETHESFLKEITGVRN